MPTKHCPRCKTEKDIAEFGPNKHKADGLAVYCRPCYQEYHRTYSAAKRHAAPTAAPLPFAKTPVRGRAVDYARQQGNLIELAHSTHQWARNRILAFENAETGGHGYFTAEEWCEHFQQSRSTWQRVQREINRLGYSLSLDPFRGGWYFGTIEQQALSMAAKIKTALAYVGNAVSVIDAVKDSKEWEDLMRLIDERLENSQYDASVSDLPKIADSARMPVSDDFERRLLGSG